ncbi:MAG: hypothetical protein WAP52_01455, partial [Candidatus Sungiibacteriota bacterium]
MSEFFQVIIGIDEAGRAAPPWRGEPRPASIIGIDEAGRGPLAGPVAVGGVKISQRIKDKGQKAREIFFGIKDSKQLTEKQREEWFLFLTTHPDLECAVAMVWPRVIDRINIRNATLLGASRVYRKLMGTVRG